MIFLVLSGRIVFFSRKYGRKMKADLSQKIHRNMILSAYLVKIVFFSLQIWYYNEIMKFSVSLKKIVCILDNMVFLLIEKLKMTKKVHIYKNVLMILCTFIESFIGTFIYCHPMKKKQETLYRTEVWVLLQVIRLETFCNEEHSILYIIHLSGAVFTGELEC